MRKLLSIWGLLILENLCFIYDLSAQIKPVDLIQRIYSVRDSYTSMSYTVNFKMKAFAWEDTIQYTADVELVRVSQDTIFQGWISIDLDSIWLGYNGVNIYYGNRLTSELVTADPILNNGAFIKSTHYINLIDEAYLKNNKGLLSMIQEGTQEIEFNDTLIFGNFCLGITIKLPDQEGFTEQRYFLALDTALNVVRHRSYSVYFQENEQYQEWNYSNVNYGLMENLASLFNEALHSYANISAYKSRSIEEKSDSSILLNEFKGVLLGTREAVDLQHSEARYILLDFWYASCYPCIKNIPQINQLTETLNNKSVKVYGVNPIDRLEKDASRLEKFMRHNPMAYPTIMPDEKCKSMIDVPGYPTLFILDENRNIIYTATGSTESLYEEVMQFLKPLLE